MPGYPDIFEFGNRSMIMDATTEDYISWAGATKQITGGVQQFWMEGNWAYYTPFSGIKDPIRFPFPPINFLHNKSLISPLREDLGPRINRMVNQTEVVS